MELAQLKSLGFSISGGQIDRGNTNYGFLSADGPVLTPEGEELVRALQVSAPEPKPESEAPRRGRRTKADPDPMLGVE